MSAYTCFLRKLTPCELMDHMLSGIYTLAQELAEHDLGLHRYDDGSPIDVKEFLRVSAQGWIDTHAEGKEFNAPTWVGYAIAPGGLDSLDDKKLFSRLQLAYSQMLISPE